MSQITLGSLTTLNLSTHLDPMFTELYALLAAITPSGTAISVGGNITLSGAGPTINFGAGGPTWGVPAANTVALSTSGSERMRVDNVGIAYWNTSSTLFSGSCRMEVLSGSSANSLGLKCVNSANAPLLAWNADTSGNNPFANFYTEGAITQRGSISYNRGGGLVAYNTTSDYRAKDVFGPVQDAGATIDAMKVYRGKMKGASVERPMLIAHELQAVAPYAVTGEKDAVDANGAPVMQQMDAQSLVPLLIAEIQSLRSRVSQLERA